MKNSKKTNNNDCLRYKHLLSNSLDGEPINEETEKHLSQCKDCSTFFAELSTIHKEALIQPLLDVPDELKQNVMAQINEAASSKKNLNQIKNLNVCKALLKATMAIFPLIILISTFSISELTLLSSRETVIFLSETGKTMTQTVYSATTITKGYRQDFINALPALVRPMRSSLTSVLLSLTPVWLSLIATFLLFTLFMNLFLIGRGNNFQRYRERTTIHGFI